MVDRAIVDFVREAAGSERYAAFLCDTLLELRAITADAGKVFDWLEGKIHELCGPAATIERGANLTVKFGAPPNLLLQTDIDSVQSTLLLAQLKLMSEIGAKFGSAKTGYIYQFGMGSPSAGAAHAILYRPTDLQVCSGHVGVATYRCKLSVGRNADMTAVELFPFVVLALESECRRLKRETTAPGFDPAQVYSNHGALGCYGRHAAAVCDRVAIQLVTQTNANPERMAMKLTQFLEEACVEYMARYFPNGASAETRHFEVKILPSAETQNFRVDVLGRVAGDTDNAITKAALLFGGLLKIAGNYPGIQAYGYLADSKPQPGLAGVFEVSNDVIVLEGLQTFSPSHHAKDVQKRMLEAATDAMKKYCKLRRRRYDAGMIEMTFDGGEARAPSTSLVPVQALTQAADALGYQAGDGTAVWSGWCDNKGIPTAIFGPGKLFSDPESVNVADLQKALAIGALATRLMTA